MIVYEEPVVDDIPIDDPKIDEVPEVHPEPPVSSNGDSGIDSDELPLVVTGPRLYNWVSASRKAVQLDGPLASNEKLLEWLLSKEWVGNVMETLERLELFDTLCWVGGNKSKGKLTSEFTKLVSFKSKNFFWPKPKSLYCCSYEVGSISRGAKVAITRSTNNKVCNI